MKLHRIKVLNLQSLYGEHELDLDVHLRGAPLFLIQGPTGAGKSTLMDAISLALFGITPRTGELRSPLDVAEAVMSKGAGEARAEVELSTWIGGERVRYRAAWAVARARRRADGAMQKVNRSLERLRPADGGWELLTSSDKQKVFGPVFQDALPGFTATDFQRSMLLAQGRFDQLLHAPPDERAAILERLTNTGIYEELGRRAAEMNRAWKVAEERIRAQRAALGLPGDDELAADRARAELLDAELRGARERVAAAQAALRWLDASRGADAELARAEARAAEAARRAAEAEPQARALAAHDRCAPAFGALDAAAAAAGDLAAAEARAQAADAALPRALTGEAAAAAAQARAKSAVDEAEQALEALRGPAQAAIDAGAALALAAAGLGAAQAERGRRAGAAAAALAAAGVAAQGAEAAAAEARRAAGAAAALAPDLARKDHVKQIQGEVTVLVRDREALALAARERAADEAARASDRAALDAEQARLEGDEQHTLGPLRAAASAAEAELGARAGGADAEDARRALDAEREALRDRYGRERLALELADARLMPLVAELARREAVVAARVEELGRAQAAASGADAAVAGAASAVSSAERALAPLRRLAELVHQRAELRPGDACPLCGALEHPLVGAGGADAVNQRVLEEAGAAARERERAEAAAAAARAAQLAAGARLQAAAVAAEEAERERARAAAAVAGARAARDAALTELGIEVQGEDAALIARLRAALAETEAAGKARAAAIDALGQAARAREQAHAALAAAEAGLAQRRQALAARRDRLAERAQIAAASRAKDEAASAELERRERAAAGALAALGAPEGELLQRAGALVRRVEAAEAAAAAAALAELRAAAAGRDAAQAAEAARLAEAELGRATEAEASAAATAASARDRVALAQARLDAVWAACAPADPGGPPAERLARQQARVAALRRELDAAAAAAAEATRAAGAAAAAAAQAGAAVEQAGQRRLSADGALAQALAALGLPDAAALAAARLPPPALEHIRGLTNRISTDSAQAAEALAGARARRAELVQARPALLEADGGADTLPGALSAAEAAAAGAEAELRAVLGRLDHVERQRALHAALGARIDALRREADPWRQLHSLIGVGDGREFKRFAQALNLRQLLERANAHLRRLSPRYRLEQVVQDAVPSLDLAVVDLWQPGVVRSPRSLSGGESFLASLALALGLSDLRATALPIETLLLDEGFGTLDAAALDLALAALQQLQAGGRQVGVISHVAALHERIPAQVRVEPLGEGRSRLCVGVP